MPTYEYACTTCHHSFDAVQSFTDDPLTECPEDGGPLRKQYGSVGVTFRGSGFYRTDSRQQSGPAPASSDGQSSGQSDASSGGAPAKTAKDTTSSSSGAPAPASTT